ncbi:MAG: transglutaminase domain-containing protein [Firmicutes bacterium]|nr:transglutaminase domain-containing protein [Bacillota bacterium]
MLNDKQDGSTVQEIYNLILALVEDGPRPAVPTFELTASYILPNGVAVGCTHYAVAFATLVRAKGIPAVIVDSAKLDWIQRGLAAVLPFHSFQVFAYRNSNIRCMCFGRFCTCVLKRSARSLKFFRQNTHLI